MQTPTNLLNAELNCPYCEKYGVAAGWIGQYTQDQLDAIALDNILKDHHGMFDHLTTKENPDDPAHSQDTESGK